MREIFTKYRKTHNDGVFDLYTPEIRDCRRSGIITGLPDAYGRGRIIGDYRRVALYGVDRLIEAKKAERAEIDARWPTEEIMRLREEMADQVRALADLKTMAASYGFDIGRPAANAREAVQWTYFGYLGAIKEMNGAAMSVGRISTFLDIYIERDLAEKALTEDEAQELDRPARDQAAHRALPAHARVRRAVLRRPLLGDRVHRRHGARRPHAGHALELPHAAHAHQPRAGAGAQHDGAVVERTCRRASSAIASRSSRDTSSLQYENDDLMLPKYGDDYGIACCVSAMRLGKQMQYFGARVNLAKALLYAINGGRDEMSGDQVGPAFRPVTGDVLDYDDVMAKFDDMMDWLARTYVHAMNCIHYSHDRYNYERLMMALHDRDILRTMAFGIAGLSVVADSLSAIKYAKVKPVRDEDGLVVDLRDDRRVPRVRQQRPAGGSTSPPIWSSASCEHLRKHPTYRDATHTQSVLTITSNVVYGKDTGNTPDGRRQGEPFGPGANPMHGRDSHGWLASCLSVARLPYEEAQDGISYTLSVVPQQTPPGRGRGRSPRATAALDTYFGQGGFHMNLNVLSKETLMDAMENPDKYPQLTIRVSGYAVNFVRLTREQQQDVISRTFFHAAI